MFRSKAPGQYVLEVEERLEDEFSGNCVHNLQRKACLVNHGPVNHKKNVYFVKQKDFDLNQTIFKPVSGLMGYKRMEMVYKLANDFMWDPKAVEKIEKEFEEFQKNEMSSVIVAQPEWDEYSSIINFMKNECDFNTEHADGSFMDHLYFCRDYTRTHYKKASPRILFLHSILGVATNIFPMEKSKLPALQDLLLPEEFKQVQAFPSILRLLNQGILTQQLQKLNKEGKIDSLQTISFHKVLDNDSMELTGEEFWVAMNMQLIHLLDFLPCSNWKSQLKDPLFQVFVELYNVLDACGKIDAQVKFDINQLKNVTEKDEFGMPVSVASMVSKVAPKSLKRSQLKKSVEAFSKKIKHSLEYKVNIDESKV